MLRALQIENYALIRSLDIKFSDGFTVITGETGAGKSILLGALSLILGSRAETDVLFDKKRKCIVEGTFDIAGLPLQDFFTQNDLDYQPQTIIRREINEHGKSRAFINDTPVTLPVLRELTSSLIDIHSQHQNLLLQDSKFRLGILDQYAQNQALQNEYRNIYAKHRHAVQRYQQLKKQCAEAALQQEFNNFTIQELDNAQLEVDEQARLEQNIRLLSNAEGIKAHLYAATQILSENENGNILQQLQSVQNECLAIEAIDSEFQELQKRLDSAVLDLKDIAYEIARKENEIEVNPQELEHLNERIDLLYTLQHKYQVDNIQGLLDLSAKIKQELSSYSDNQDQLAELDKERAHLESEVLRLATLLSKSRNSVIAKFKKEIEQCLKSLGMSDSKFDIEISQSDEPQVEGIDQVRFLFSANKGVEPSELSRIASGGEMSRIMLALKSIITDSTLLPTVIFDEIDTGISGETANKVAAVMGTLSQQHQVIAISHLPQIAAHGDQHYLVFKHTHDSGTFTELRQLDMDGRVEHIANMLGGSNITDTVRSAARELIASAQHSNSK